MPKKSQQPKIPKNVASVYRICKVLCRFTRDISRKDMKDAMEAAFLADPGDPDDPRVFNGLTPKGLQSFSEFHAAITKGRK